MIERIDLSFAEKFYEPSRANHVFYYNEEYKGYHITEISLSHPSPNCIRYSEDKINDHYLIYFDKNIVVWDRFYQVEHENVLITKKLIFESIVTPIGKTVEANFIGRFMVFCNQGIIEIAKDDHIYKKRITGRRNFIDNGTILENAKILFRDEDGNYYDASGLQTKSAR